MFSQGFVVFILNAEMIKQFFIQVYIDIISGASYRMGNFIRFPVIQGRHQPFFAGHGFPLILIA